MLADFGAFGGAIIEADGDYIVPADAESFAGFLNLADENYPITLPYGGRITFMASVPSGASADLRFSLESIYGDFDTLVETSIVTVSGSTPQTYTLDIPPQGATNFGSLLMYLLTRDEAVKVEEVYLEPAPAPVYAKFDGAFDGFIADGDFFEFPSGAASYAGVANTNTDLYPLFFPNGGEIRFMAEGPLEGIDPGVFFLLENAPYLTTRPRWYRCPDNQWWRHHIVWRSRLRIQTRASHRLLCTLLSATPVSASGMSRSSSAQMEISIAMVTESSTPTMPLRTPLRRR